MKKIVEDETLLARTKITLGYRLIQVVDTRFGRIYPAFEIFAKSEMEMENLVLSQRKKLSGKFFDRLQQK